MAAPPPIAYRETTPFWTTTYRTRLPTGRRIHISMLFTGVSRAVAVVVKARAWPIGGVAVLSVSGIGSGRHYLGVSGRMSP
ncbi:hypothetical protein GCM10027290_43630 [Micromonospora sonneratiae]